MMGWAENPKKGSLEKWEAAGGGGGEEREHNRDKRNKKETEWAGVV